MKMPIQQSSVRIPSRASEVQGVKVVVEPFVKFFIETVIVVRDIIIPVEREGSLSEMVRCPLLRFLSPAFIVLPPLLLCLLYAVLFFMPKTDFSQSQRIVLLKVCYIGTTSSSRCSSILSQLAVFIVTDAPIVVSVDFYWLNSHTLLFPPPAVF